MTRSPAGVSPPSPGTGRPRDDGSIEVTGLTKRFGPVTAVADLGFRVDAGMVTGFLGPNGAGKTTTMRMMLGLVRPDAGHALIGGRRYEELPRPTSTVGAVLDSSGLHPTRTGRDHLRLYCAMGGHSRARVSEVLDLLQLTAVADRPARGYSTGMRQRLNLAVALLGDPRVLLLDEPGNGLDPAGAAWLRGLLRGLADEGRTVLVSSHVLAEVAALADRVVVVKAGRLVADAPTAELTSAADTLVVRTPDADDLARVLGAQSGERGSPISVRPVGSDRLHIDGLDAAALADLVAAHGLRVHELTSRQEGLEEVFLRLTSDKESSR
ncbi:ABC-2 type transport system ATP-binding protein [Actinoalloteichus hoggarensis]|uniref:Daunorubicin/doxorubicin resistance ATP-binding protein DrrA n=1 Tax=Actinoalloteichus hoggarensis TaxID=1470176 RepID=A0A221VZY1_9PSEU|nr:ATP-binding cassette domain-containing protein [Actinoalloteichus hoggarensis]ASO19082.1 Daunorubicin/doxorubicin resistance ATP-binding protein DrrA [Actinoalloteichus hoggarensis]MBB5920320.1 ABC-2 type transport system ATP-binding protein [Actinoalloteichus hoggarensis]